MDDPYPPISFNILTKYIVSANITRNLYNVNIKKTSQKKIIEHYQSNSNIENARAYNIYIFVIFLCRNLLKFVNM